MVPGEVKSDRVIYTIESDTGLTKVGIATDVWSRLKQLQTGNPHKLWISSAFCVEQDGVDAGAMERRIHERLASYRVVGEWFLVPRWILQAAWKQTWVEFRRPDVYSRWYRRFGRYQRMWRLAERSAAPQLFDKQPIWLPEMADQRLKEGKTE